jgi:two-component system sensor histidine kinase PhoQ
MLNSLLSRLLLMTSIMLISLAFAGGFLLQQSFSVVQIKALKERLKVHSYSLLAQIDFQDNTLTAPKTLSDHHFNQQKSGLYAIILNENNQRSWASISAKTLPNFNPSPIIVGKWQYSRAANGSEELFIARYGVSWDDNTFNILLIKDMKDINTDLKDYQKTLFILLGSAALFLFIMHFLILRWGLTPLKDLSDDLKKIQDGEKEKLSGNYPKELRSLTSNLNHLLKIEQNQRERYRHSLADLSHSLKTPISVIQGISYKQFISNEDQQDLQTQAGKMTNTIRYQLQRAVNGFQGLYINRVPIRPLVKSITDAMHKVYADKKLKITIQVASEYYFHGDENDLMEILGNLIDNACKYCNNQVAINIEASENHLTLYIADDGNGIPLPQREVILQRGVRLDTVEAGSGMGLALVKEIIDAYQASINISDSELGGTCVEICFNTKIIHNS